MKVIFYLGIKICWNLAKEPTTKNLAQAVPPSFAVIVKVLSNVSCWAIELDSHIEGFVSFTELGSFAFYQNVTLCFPLPVDVVCLGLFNFLIYC